MKKDELKKVLKPLIKECIKEVIFEEGVLSSLITEVAQGLNNSNIQTPIRASTQQPKLAPQENVLEARKQLNEVKQKLQQSAGLQGIFEGTQPLRSSKGAQGSKYGALRDKDPGDAGVNIEGLVKMTGGWSHLK
jgi:hypothetical protein